MKNKKGFTLVELLAVIAILSIIMVVAVIGVINLLNSSKDSGWDNTVKNVKESIELKSNSVPGVVNTYTISSICNNETTSNKDVSQTIRTISGMENINAYCKKDTSYIFTLNGKDNYDGKTATITCNSNGVCSSNSNDGTNIGQEVIVNEDIKCVGATELSYDERFGYIGKISNVLVPGTALDCKVKKSGDYTERFYYVSDLSTDSDYAVLIYNNNVKVSNGIASVNNKSGPTYHSSNNYNGPVSALSNLPSTSDWDNVSLRYVNRKIVSDTGGTTASGNALPSSFSYEGKAARLLTYQELLNACGANNYNGTSGLDFSNPGYLLSCSYLLDNTCTETAHGYWLETPLSTSTKDALLVYGCYSSSSYNYQLNHYIAYGDYDGVRPAIEVKKSQILLNQTVTNLTPNTIYNFSTSKAITLPKGKYKLEVWGAQGGSTSSSSTVSSIGGYGAYSVGNITITDDTTLFVSIGGMGESSTSGASKTLSGGDNGGGNGANGRSTNGTSASGGGGATHIALAPGKLYELDGNRNKVLIVAGGGGGSHTDTDGNGYNSKGGNAGGYIGNSAVQIAGSCSSSCTTYSYPSGGTQNSGGLGVTSWSSGTTSTTQYVGTFGQGATGSSSYGGGGGGYYGGASGSYSGGGGGSSYISTTLTDAAMYCYDCAPSTEPATKTISNQLVNENPEPMNSKIGAGYARITYISQ